MGKICLGVVLVVLLSNECSCVAKDKIRIGLFLNDNQDAVFFSKFLDKGKTILGNVEIVSGNRNISDITIIPDNNIFEASRKLCAYLHATMEERVFAIVGPNSPQASLVLESASSKLSIPYILTSWRPISYQQRSNVLNVFPDADLLSKGLAKIVKSFDWSGFVLLYENDEGLLRLQDVLKLKRYDSDGALSSKDNVLILKLSPGEDNRRVLKRIKSLGINRIILDCHVDRILDIFRQAKQVDLLSDFSRSFFLTSLDAHTLDFTTIVNQMNITTVRLFDPFQIKSNIIREYFSEESPSQIRVDTALTFDAVRLIIEGIKKLKYEGVELGPGNINCNTHKELTDDLNIIDTLHSLTLDESTTITGPVSFSNGKRDKFLLEVIEVDKPEKPIAVWTSEEPDKISLKRNATEREAEFQRRVASYRFIVTSKLGDPYLMENKDVPIDKKERYYGYSMDLITEVAKIVNMTFTFKITEKNSNENLVKDLVERNADLGVCDFTITSQRREVIDFTMPFMSLGIGILHKRNTQDEEVDNMYAFMRPISWKVWGYMWLLSLVSSLTMFFVARMAPGEWENPKPWDPESKELENIWNVKNFLWLSLGSITTQGCDILPKSVPTRVISASWWVFSLIITSSYTANLAAFLTMQRQDVTIDSVEELASQSRVKYGLMEKGSTETFFSTSNNTLYQKMWSVMKNERPTVFVKDNKAGVERVNNTNFGLYAFFMESTGIEYALENECNLRRIGEPLDQKGYGIGMPLNADYSRHINRAVLHLKESGKLTELKEKWWKKMRDKPPCEKKIDQGDALALSNVGGIFVVLGVGIALAYLIAIFEFLWHVRGISVEEHLPYMETLKCELKFACNIFARKKRAKPLPSESSSTSRSFERDKLSIAKSIFSKSASLLNVNITEPESELRSRCTASKTPKNSKNNLRVNID